MKPTTGPIRPICPTRPTCRIAPLPYRVALGSGFTAALLSACATPPVSGPAANTPPLACDDGIKSAFKPDALTSVVAVQALKKGDKIFVADSGVPVSLAADLCLVKLKVGPGNPGPAEARSTSAGIGIEVWLPTHADWNQRIRNYGGGGYVGGGHLSAANNGATLPSAVGSKCRQRRRHDKTPAHPPQPASGWSAELRMA